MTMLTRRAFAQAAAAILIAAGVAPLAARGTSSALTAGSVTVSVKYTGKGAVDGDHKVWIWLFDSPDIGPGSMPIREDSVSANGEAAVFGGLGDQQVWIAVAYDESGGFAGMAPPPSGAPIGVYSVEGGRPSSAAAADDEKVVVTFDDSIRMP